jgi:signal transduction histidine kinase
MQGFAEALVDDCGTQLDEMGREYAGRIISAATRMDLLIQDLLTYSRMSHVELELQPLDLESVIAQALHQLEVPIREANAEISQQKPFPRVMAHHGTAVQLVCNLISNAIKFVTPGLRPRVTLRTEQCQHVVRLWVEDNGIGIAPEFHGRIFRVFERLHGVDKYPGSGVGLAIVRKAAERMQGRVGVESALGQGSRFWIELPLSTEGANTASS